MQSINILDQLEALRFVEKRRWDIFLKKAIVMKLSMQIPKRFLEVYQKLMINGYIKANTIIDMRLMSGKLYISNKRNNKGFVYG